MSAEMVLAPPSVADVVGELWRMRARRSGRVEAETAMVMGRCLAIAVVHACSESERYSPEEDKRVLWARAILAAALRGVGPCWAGAELEATAEYLLGFAASPALCGKDHAAGGGHE
jgi:hypothetical protein